MSPSPQAAHPEPFAHAVTASRAESKYCVPTQHCADLLRRLVQALTPHRFRGEGENRLPEAVHFNTSVYFDTPSRALFRAAVSRPDHNVKLRAREYHDLHPSLAEVATASDQLVRTQPWLWMELKRRQADRTTKLRFRAARERVASLWNDPEGAEFTGDPDFAEARAFARSLSEPLAPSSIVQYRRVALHDELVGLRVTLDVDIAYYAVPPRLFADGRPLVRGTFGAPRAVEPFALLEVKRRGALPPWLQSLLHAYGTEATHFSKFVRAEQLVHGT